MDSTLVEVPRPQLSQTEQQRIKQGELPASRKDIIAYKVTDASVADVKVFEQWIDKGVLTSEKRLWADKASYSQKTEQMLRDKGVESHWLESGVANNPLSQIQQSCNWIKNRILARVEHVFALLAKSISRMTSRLIGKRRNQTVIGMDNLL